MDLRHNARVVDALVGEAGAGVVGIADGAFEVLDEAAAEFAFHDGVVVAAEDVGAGNGEFVDDAGTEEGDALVLVGDGLEGAGESLEGFALFVAVVEVHEDVLRLVVGEDAQFVGVLDVHDLVADVVCRLDQVDERVADVLEGMLGELPDAQFFSHEAVDVLFALEEAVFEAFGIGFGGLEGVFDDGRQRGVGHGVTAGAPPVEIVCQKPEGVGIAFEVAEVVPFLVGEKFFEVAAFAFAEEVGDGFLAGMPERRVAEVVRQAASADDGADFFEEFGVVEPDLLLDEELPDFVAEGTPYACHFQAVGKPVVDEDITRKREYLRLVLQPSEGGGEDKPVIIPLELRAVVGLEKRRGMAGLVSAGGEQVVPVHRAINF